MKKSEKIKGKEKAAVKKKTNMMIAAIAAIIIIIAVGSWFFFFNPSVARSGDTVSVYYTGILDNGTVFDTNMNATPLVFTLGKGNVIPGFEEAVIGMAPNTTKTVHIPVDKAYGPYQEALVHVVNRSTLPDTITPVVGERYSIRRISDGGVAYVKIINMTPSTITWDENHELAGKDLTFTINLIGISK
jgi:peptidylprolyl isomerase